MSTLINLRKAVAGRLWWENQHGNQSNLKPGQPTLFGRPVGDEKIYQSEELVRDAARRLGSLDVWTPHFKATMSARQTYVFQGDQALKMNDAWKGIVYGSKS